MDDLRKHKLDGAIIDSGFGQYFLAFSNDISIFDEYFGEYDIAFGFPKGEKYKDEFNDFLKESESEIDSKSNDYDYGYDNEASTLDLDGNNGTINVILRVDAPPYSYKLNGDLYGTEVLAVYSFAKKYGEDKFNRIRINSWTSWIT